MGRFDKQQLAKWVLCLFISLFSYESVWAQASFMVSGKVTDAATGNPVGATITYQSYPDASDVYIIDAQPGDGIYRVELHALTQYLIEVIGPDYKPEIDTVFLEDSKDNIDFKLLSVKPGQVLNLHNIYFAQGDYKILPSSNQGLAELIILLNQYPEMEIQLEGHTDFNGGRKNNFILSENRVNEIKKYLVDNGIDKKRVKTKAFGGTNPISKENTETARNLNRRVEIRIL